MVRAFLGSPFWHNILAPMLREHRTDALTALHRRDDERKARLPDDELWGMMKEAEKIERDLVNLVQGHDSLVAEQAAASREEGALAPLVAGGRHGPDSVVP